MMLRVVVAFGFVLSLLASAQAATFQVGAGRADITGPAGGIGMIGYANLDQNSAGIHTRLYSRAFVIQAGLGAEKRVVFVSADLGFISQAVKLEVVARLQKVFPGVYSNDNVMLTATHTHSGPGGFTHFQLYNITMGGFQEQNFEAIVSGIVRSIETAHRSVQSANLYFNEGRLDGASVNRSLAAYRSHPNWQDEKDETNKIMSVIRAVSEEGQEIGMLNWFAVHATTMSKHNKLISSDNKGYASYLFEKRKPGVIAAFGNSEEGDAAPNIYDEHFRRKYEDLESVRLSGEAQFGKAWELYHTATFPLEGQIDFRHLWIRMPGRVVPAEYTGDTEQKVCKAALGYSFAAGAEDGPSEVPGIYEGMKQGEINPISSPISLLIGALGIVLAPPNAQDDACQFPKPIFVATGRQKPSWTPDVLPFQVFRIGEVALVGVPGEMTTLAGRELKRIVLERLGSVGVKRVIIAGLANSYSNYITTKFEYDQQNYEGASTLFGPHTFSAYREVFAKMSEALRDQREISSGDTPDRIPYIPTAEHAEWFDARRLWEKYGQVLKEPSEVVRRSESVKATFRSAHPNHDLRPEGTFMELQRQDGSGWVTVATDADPELIFHWKAPYAIDCLGCTDATAEWRAPASAPTGVYRFVHLGKRKKGSGKLSDFGGVSREFTLR